jgi:hypothetical protein
MITERAEVAGESDIVVETALDPIAARIVAVDTAGMSPAVAVKVVELAPAATVTDAGAVTEGELSVTAI